MKVGTEEKDMDDGRDEMIRRGRKTRAQKIISMKG
jgi:hypothetical protein